MKKVFLLFIIALISNSLLGQTQKNPDPNTTVITLIILNDNGEVLIKKATIGWITIGTFYEQRQTLNEVIASLSNKYGVSISKPELKGVFTYKFGFNNSISVRQFYVAKSTTNDLPKNKKVEFHWAPKDEAIEKFKGTVPSFGEMVEQILDYPQVVWGGSFLINRENEKTTSEQTEDFYPISDPSTYINEPNKTVVRLTILNDNGDVLMKESDYGWMTIATFHTERQNINEVIDSLTTEYGITITKPSLAGVFTYKYKFKESSDIRQLYTAKYIKGDLESGKRDHNLAWLPKEEAIEKLKNTVPSLGEMTQQILDFPEEIWGGSFLLDRDENWKLSSEMTEDFHLISDPSAYRTSSSYSTSSSNASIEKALQNYMEGSSYNKLDMLESAFTDNATLYLTNKDGVFKLYTPKEYTGFFKNAEYGTFNGRYAKILEIEQTKDIATAKIEIAGTERKWVYIDLFLLKKSEDGWKIISKTATRIDNPKENAVLFIVSNAHFYGDTKISTGNSFSEIVNAYDVFKNAGYTVDFVSPKGGAVPLAYINTSDDMSKKYLYDTNFMNALKNTKSPSEINASKYKAVQYIGGGSAMFGVPENKEIQKIAMDVYEKHNGIISSVCHGTAGIVNLKTRDGKYLVDGKRVSGYPDDYENKSEPYFKTFPFLIKKTIEERGGSFRFSERGKFTLEVDGRLVTGQNFQSSKPVSLRILELIKLNEE